MSRAVSWDEAWQRWAGSGVPAYCDHPGCETRINRDLTPGTTQTLCGAGPDHDPEPTEAGCGGSFCSQHRHWSDLLRASVCGMCVAHPGLRFTRGPEHPDWLVWILLDPSWYRWRDDEVELVTEYRRQLEEFVVASTAAA